MAKACWSTQVLPNTPAAEAGFEAGDVITKFAGQKVKDRADLQALVERVPVDTHQEVEVLRDGKTANLARHSQGDAEGAWSPRPQGDARQGRAQRPVDLRIR